MKPEIYTDDEYIEWALNQLKLQDLKENYEKEIQLAIENDIGYRKYRD